ncbi:hypothetical protein BKA56DRAFT_550312 [Ilyonectria sp. MPI-CAGE-AT-0026]|nr:hypothetical protein BKA56DRAFT_550312 [Ilyonectria sp. MPI-CAGE-AT-0026]
MINGISEAQPRRSRVRLSKSLQGHLLNAIAKPSPVSAGIPQDAPTRPTKRQLDEIDQLHAKKARLTDAQQPEVEGERTPVLQHPKPKPPYACFLEKFIHPSQPGPYSLVLEWLESIGSDRDKRCRSDSYLDLADDGPIPRQFTRSAPAMTNIQDADGFMVPLIPASTGSHSQADAPSRSGAPSDVTESSSGPAGTTLVKTPHYRIFNLRSNNIYFPGPPYREFPEPIASIIDIVRKDRHSPGPSLEDVKQDVELAALLWMGADKTDVETHFRFRTDFFPHPCITETLRQNIRTPMAKHTVPSTGSSLKVSTPIPDLLYGYNRRNAFPQQQTQLNYMGTEMIADNGHGGTYYPFFVIEFKGDGDSLWVATNQYLGGSVSCVNIAEKLNSRLREYKSDTVYPINSAAFSIAMNDAEARLYISWKHNELDYHMAYVDSFYLHDPEQYLRFRKYILNILDWGRDKRLEGIRKALNSLLEES